MKTLLLLSTLALTSCASSPAISIKDAVSIAENDLNFKAYEIRMAPITEVWTMCRSMFAVGCTSSRLSLISSATKGCYRVEALFHELKHQKQFIEHARTGIPQTKEAPAYAYGIEMSQKHCR